MDYRRNVCFQREKGFARADDFQKKLSYIDSVRDDADKIHKMQEAIDKSDNFWKVFNEFNENFNNYKELYSETNKRIETINETLNGRLAKLNSEINENKKYFCEETEKINNFVETEI